MNSIFVLNTLIMAGIIVGAVSAIIFENIVSSVIAIGIVGLFIVIEFILLQAPDVAMTEAVVSLLIYPIMFIVGLKKVREGRRK